MKRLSFFIFLMLFGAAAAAAQFSRTNNVTEIQLTVLQREIAPLYRKPTKKELQAIEPNRALFSKYAEFLRQSETGLTKLVDNKECAENTKVVNVSENCLKYSMPGAGGSFSFRTENYRLPRFADLNFTDNSFQASGILLHGIFVNLGDVPLEETNLQTRGMRFLLEFKPETDFDKSRAIDEQFKEGVRRDGFLYRRGLFIVENTTFALRSIAYEGKSVRSVKGIKYNELDFDRRRDVIVVFRIVEKAADGSVTILWKKLQDRDSPKIRKVPNY